MRWAMMKYRIGHGLPEPVKRLIRRWLNRRKARQRKALKDAAIAQH